MAVEQIQLGDAASWFAALVAAVAAGLTVRQLQDAKSAGRADDERRRKQLAVDLAKDWCAGEATSPLSILRECLVDAGEAKLEQLLKGEPVAFRAAFDSELRAFFGQILEGRVVEGQIQTDAHAVVVGEAYARLLRNYFARRINFLEVVAGAINEGLADQSLMKAFFGGIIEQNSAYRTAVKLRPDGWPELRRYYGEAQTARGRAAAAA